MSMSSNIRYSAAAVLMLFFAASQAAAVEAARTFVLQAAPDSPEWHDTIAGLIRLNDGDQAQNDGRHVVAMPSTGLVTVVAKDKATQQAMEDLVRAANQVTDRQVQMVLHLVELDNIPAVSFAGPAGVISPVERDALLAAPTSHRVMDVRGVTSNTKPFQLGVNERQPTILNSVSLTRDAINTAMVTTTTVDPPSSSLIKVSLRPRLLANDRVLLDYTFTGPTHVSVGAVTVNQGQTVVLPIAPDDVAVPLSSKEENLEGRHRTGVLIVEASELVPAATERRK